VSGSEATGGGSRSGGGDGRGWSRSGGGREGSGGRASQRKNRDKNDGKEKRQRQSRDADSGECNSERQAEKMLRSLVAPDSGREGGGGEGEDWGLGAPSGDSQVVCEGEEEGGEKGWGGGGVSSSGGGDGSERCSSLDWLSREGGGWPVSDESCASGVGGGRDWFDRSQSIFFFSFFLAGSDP
jgi:hypothetical protein